MRGRQRAINIAVQTNRENLFLSVNVGARIKIPRSGRCRITQNEGSLKLTGLLISVAHLHRRSCVGSEGVLDFV